MASNYFPMVSSSPPPLDDGPSLDDEDEFGNFTSSSLSFYDDQAFPSGVVVENSNLYHQVPHNVADSGSNNTVLQADTSGAATDDDYDDFKSHHETLPVTTSSIAVSDAKSDPQGHLQNTVGDGDEGGGKLGSHPHGGPSVEPGNSPTVLQDTPDLTDAECPTKTAEPSVNAEESHHEEQDDVHDASHSSVQDSSEINSGPIDGSSPIRTHQQDSGSEGSANSDAGTSSGSLELTQCQNDRNVPPVPDGIPEAPMNWVPGETEANASIEVKSKPVVEESAPGETSLQTFAVNWEDTAGLNDSWDVSQHSRCGAEATAENEYFVPDVTADLTWGRVSTMDSEFAVVSTVDSAEEFTDFSTVEATQGSSSANGGRTETESEEWHTTYLAGGQDFIRDDDAQEEEEDDFGNFATFAMGDTSASRPPSTFQSLGPDSTAEDIDGDEDEFGSFDSSRPVAADAKELQQRSSRSSADVWTLAFPDPHSDFVSITVQHLEEELKKSSQGADGSKSKKSVWLQLYDIDSTQALQYHWNHSHTNKKLLRALRIESRNVLSGTKWSYSSMPLFAANLGVDPLEPTKAPFATGEVETGTTAAPIGNNRVVQSNNSTSQEAVIPPAQFDWGSSGLVNPLDDSTSSLLDLDFFFTNDVHSAAAAASSFPFSATSANHNCLESEFLGGPQSSTSHDNQPDVSHQGISPLLDKILSDAARSYTTSYSQSRVRASSLGEEARRILDSLPDLSFMQAKVLMFPIRSAVP